MPRLASKTLAVGLVAAGCTSALAQSPAQEWLDSRFVVNLGGFVVGSTVEARLDGDIQAGEEVDFDEQFGLGADATRWRVDALWRITPRHQLRLGYFGMRDSGSATLDEDITWGDYTFTAGARASARLEADNYWLSYEYAFLRRPSYEVATVIGVHYSDVDLTLSGQATLIDANGNVIDDDYATKAASAPIPLPLVGLRGNWVVSPRWVLEAGATYFRLSYGEFDGYWGELRASATWMYNRHVGLGVGYNLFRTAIDAEDDSFTGRLDWNYSGLQIYLVGTF